MSHLGPIWPILYATFDIPVIGKKNRVSDSVTDWENWRLNTWQWLMTIGVHLNRACVSTHYIILHWDLFQMTTAFNNHYKKSIIFNQNSRLLLGEKNESTIQIDNKIWHWERYCWFRDSDIYSLTGYGYINDKRKKMISLIMKEETRAPFNLFTVSPSLFWIAPFYLVNHKLYFR